MKIVITGASGGLGRTAVEWCLNNGIQVVALVRDTVTNKHIVEQWQSQYPNLLTAHFVDLCMIEHVAYYDLCRMLEGATSVWHIGAKADDWGPSDEFIKTNVIATRRLAQASISAQVESFVFISTPAVYFNFTPRYNVVEEDVAAHGVNWYASSKMMAEEILSGLSCSGTTRMITLRPRALIGKYDRILIPRLLSRIRKRLLILPNSGATLLDLTSMHNVVDAMYCATISQARGVFNITNGAPILLRSALSLLHSSYTKFGYTAPFDNIIGIPPRVALFAAKMIEARASLKNDVPSLTQYSVGVISYDMTLNIDRARHVLGYNPSHKLEDAVDEYVRFKEMHNG